MATETGRRNLDIFEVTTSDGGVGVQIGDKIIMGYDAADAEAVLLSAFIGGECGEHCERAYLTITETAGMLCVPCDEVRAMTDRGELHPIKTKCSMIYDRGEVERIHHGGI